MYRKIVWCYIIVLTLLDISLNTKLSAQGKSHGNGVSVHESLMEGISLQEWGKDGASGGGGEGAGRGRAVPAGVLALAPAALAFGPAALAAPHARQVTITNTGNETIHLASVTGTTTDFHASFFESKSLAPLANTSFTVVYLGRREGPASAYLYIHTSKGVHKYPVSAVGVASEYRVWPLVGLRVPLNATLRPRLTLYNPTDATIQVSEVYSSGSWVGLSLPGGGATLDRAAWAVPPGATRDLLALELGAGAGAGAEPRTAYVRIKGSWGGAPLVVCVEAAGAPPGVYLAPPQLRLGVRGSGDPPERFPLHAGSSAAAPLDVTAAVEGAGCAAPGDAPPPPPAHHNGRSAPPAPPGATLALTRDTVPPHTPPSPAPLAHLTLDYGKLWAGAGASGEARYCAGWARVGDAHAPYSVTLLPGTVELHPKHLHFVTANPEEALKVQEITAHNRFPVPVMIAELQFPDEVEEYFHTESVGPVTVGPGQQARLGALRLRATHATRELHAVLRVPTNVTDYLLPLLLYSGKFHIEWEWPLEAWSESQLDLGVVSTGGSVEVVGRVRAGAGAGAGAGLRSVAAALDAPPHGGHATLTLIDEHEEESISSGVVSVRLSVVAPTRAGAARGWLELRSAHSATRLALLLHAHPGDLRVPDLRLPPIAPYVWSSTPLVVESSMALRMRVLNVTQPPRRHDPALFVTLDVERSVRPGRSVVGSVSYAPEVHCAPHCYTGLEVGGAAGGEGWAWAMRGGGDLAADGAAARARRASLPARAHRADLLLETARVRRLRATVRAQPAWPRLAHRPALAWPLAAVAAPAPASLTLHNPSSTHTLLLQPHIHHQRIDIDDSNEDCPECKKCGSSFTLGEWRATRGAVSEWSGGAGGGYLLLQPRAQLDLTVTFTPADAADLAAYLYLRNNLTILERVLVRGRGAHPMFELGGREPNSTAPIVLEVSECGADGGAGAARRALLVRNTGAVPLRLRGWRVAGAACAARGFRLRPCAALALAPNESRALHLAFAADWTRARARAALAVRAGDRTHEFQVAGAVPARTLARCAAAARRPPFEPALRALGAALALLALAGAAALAAADAERALRRHRAQRPPPPPARDPLDLRALARPAPPVPPAPAPRRRRTPRRRLAPALDPAAERLAFERWRAEVERRAAGAGAGDGGGGECAEPLRDDDDDDTRSSEEGEAEGATPPRPHTPPPPPSRDETSTSSSPDSSPPPRDSYSRARSRDRDPEEEEEEEEEGASTGSDSSCAGDDRSDGSEGGAGAGAVAAPAPAPRLPPHPACLEPGCRRRDAPRPPPARGLRAPARRDRAPRRRDRAPEPPRPARPEPPRVPPVRWGTSWSSVVSSRAPSTHPDPPPPPPPRPAPPVPSSPPASDNVTGAGGGAPLAPIGSDVRRRLGSHSLFFYSGGEGGAAPGSAAPTARWPPGEEAPPEPAYRALEALWGGDAWSWGGGARAAPAPAPAPLRPPPGFPLPRAVRPYDPFHSLASIWTPAALDWRLDSAAPAPAPGATPPPDDKFDASPPNGNNTN